MLRTERCLSSARICFGASRSGTTYTYVTNERAVPRRAVSHLDEQAERLDVACREPSVFQTITLYAIYALSSVVRISLAMAWRRASRDATQIAAQPPSTYRFSPSPRSIRAASSLSPSPPEQPACCPCGAEGRDLRNTPLLVDWRDDHSGMGDASAELTAIQRFVANTRTHRGFAMREAAADQHFPELTLQARGRGERRWRRRTPGRRLR